MENRCLGSVPALLFSLTAAATVPAHGVQERIQAVENGLRAVVQVKGEPVETWTLAERMAHYHVPGISIAVINEGRLEWAQGYGVKQAGGDDPVTTETLFQAGSISKPVAALAALALVDAGKLDL